MIIEQFKSEHIDCDQTWFSENEIIGLCLTLSQYKKLKNNFKEIQDEIMSKNQCIKSIAEPMQVTLYYDEEEGYWVKSEPSDFNWWAFKKKNYIRDFKICSFVIKEGYKLIKEIDN